MSYDLYFTSPKIPLEEFNAFFAGNPLYEGSGTQAFYSNKNTGVYFSFEHNAMPPEEDEIEHFAMFNLNYYRPHYFALEAEPEIRKFIDHFGCSIHDYQNEGMGDGPYTREGFLTGWNHGNEFGYRAILANEDAPTIIHAKSTSELERIWHWNFTKEKRQTKATEDIFIPAIMLILVDGALVSTAVWPDAISTLIPDVDVLFIPRKELVPKKFLQKKKDEDFCLLRRADFPTFFQGYATDAHGLRAFQLPAPQTPKAVKDYVQSLREFTGQVEGVPLDQVLNSELVEKCRKPFP